MSRREKLCPDSLWRGTNILGGMAIMKGRDAEHVHVLRMRPGEDMIICDGHGTDYKCRLVKADKEQVEAEVIEGALPAEPSVKVTVLCGLPKGDKTDYIIQKCVEAGAYEILFFSSSRCIAKLGNEERSWSAGSASPRRPPSSPAAASSRRSAGRVSLRTLSTSP